MTRRQQKLPPPTAQALLSCPRVLTPHPRSMAYNYIRNKRKFVAPARSAKQNSQRAPNCLGSIAAGLRRKQAQAPQACQKSGRFILISDTSPGVWWGWLGIQTMKLWWITAKRKGKQIDEKAYQLLTSGRTNVRRKPFVNSLRQLNYKMKHAFVNKNKFILQSVPLSVDTLVTFVMQLLQTSR